MNFKKLIGQVKTNRAQEFLGARFKLPEEAQNVLTQGRQIFSPRMPVQLVLLELAPELLDRIAPRGIGRQLHESLWGDATAHIA